MRFLGMAKNENQYPVGVIIVISQNPSRGSRIGVRYKLAPDNFFIIQETSETSKLSLVVHLPD